MYIFPIPATTRLKSWLFSTSKTRRRVSNAPLKHTPLSHQVHDTCSRYGQLAVHPERIHGQAWNPQTQVEVSRLTETATRTCGKQKVLCLLLLSGHEWREHITWGISSNNYLTIVRDRLEEYRSRYLQPEVGAPLVAEPTVVGPV